MEMWFSDEHTEDVKLSIRVREQLFSAQSEFQQIDVLDSKEFGKILVVDGDLTLTEKDEFIYHEMITHVPMAVHPLVKDVLVIGGGDGGVVRELVKYEEIEHIDMVEIDPLLVEVCRKYLPQIACSLNDPRVQIFHEDGLRFVRSKTDCYDLIIIDSPNPFGLGEGLFTKEFYGNCFGALREDGIMINQNESPFYTEEAFQCQRMHKRILETFPICRVYQAHLPLILRALAVWVCLKEIPSSYGSERSGLEAERNPYKILRTKITCRSVCPSGICGGAFGRC